MQVRDTVKWESRPVLAPTIQLAPLYFPTGEGRWTVEHTWVRTREFVWMPFPVQRVRLVSEEVT